MDVDKNFFGSCFHIRFISIYWKLFIRNSVSFQAATNLEFYFLTARDFATKNDLQEDRWHETSWEHWYKIDEMMKLNLQNGRNMYCLSQYYTGFHKFSCFVCSCSLYGNKPLDLQRKSENCRGWLGQQGPCYNTDIGPKFLNTRPFGFFLRLQNLDGEFENLVRMFERLDLVV